MGANKNGVIITLYVESVTKNRNKNIHNGIKKKRDKAVSLPEPFLQQGYDRRSQLLAHARNLRNANRIGESYHPQKWSKNKKSWLKSKKWRWSPSLGRIRLRFNGLCYLLKRQRKYKIPKTEEQSGLECLLGRERVINLRKRKARNTSYSQFWRRLGSICIGLICAWPCNRGAKKKI